MAVDPVTAAAVFGASGGFNSKKKNTNSGGGFVSEALNKYRTLKTALDKGQLSQTDFINQVGQFLPQVTKDANRFASQGSQYASSAVNAGLNDLYEAAKEFNVYQSAKELLGRDITAQEVAEFKPRFTDPFNSETGRSYLAELSKQEAKSPEALAKKAPQFSGQIGGYYQDLLKRGATTEEADYFGRLLATGQVTPYEIQQFIRATPEFQTQEDKSFREGLEGELAGYDTKAFQRERENILSQYSKAGLQNSSALDYAMTDALGRLQEQRGQFLGGLSASQYGGNKELARRDYESNLNRYFGEQDYGRKRSDAYLDYLTQRSDEAKDYQRQKDDYLQFLSGQSRQRGGGGWGGLAGGLLGLGVGSMFPGGAGAGYQIGAGLGNSFDYLNY